MTESISASTGSSGTYRGGVEDNPNAQDAESPVRPEVVDAPPGATPDGAAADGADVEPTEHVSQPTKLIRIASMVRTMLDEVRRAPLDEEGRRSLRTIHERSMIELKSVLSADLREELEDVALPLTGDAPSESQLRLAQAQLVGWLEGLFHGIQASLFTQQAAAQQQLDQVRNQRAIEMGAPPSEGGSPGAYL